MTQILSSKIDKISDSNPNQNEKWDLQSIKKTSALGDFILLMYSTRILAR